MTKQECGIADVYMHLCEVHHIRWQLERSRGQWIPRYIDEAEPRALRLEPHRQTSKAGAFHYREEHHKRFRHALYLP